MQVSMILRIADRLPLKRLRYRADTQHWFYQGPNQSHGTEYAHNEPGSFQKLVESLQTKDYLAYTAAQLEETLDYIRARPEVWTNRGSRQEPEGPLTQSAGR